MLVDDCVVTKFLPHREPFLFVDNIKEIVFPELLAGEKPTVKDFLGSEVVATYLTKPDHPIFAGHFPGHPVFPGVLQVEMMAQVAGFAFIKIFDDDKLANVKMAFMSIQSAKFRKPILPNMQLLTKTKCLKVRGGVNRFSGQIYHNEELMAEAEFTASISF